MEVPLNAPEEPRAAPCGLRPSARLQSARARQGANGLNACRFSRIRGEAVPCLPPGALSVEFAARPEACRMNSSPLSCAIWTRHHPLVLARFPPLPCSGDAAFRHSYVAALFQSQAFGSRG
jgi:hypothetical protein